jgi:hypothetical protein
MTRSSWFVCDIIELFHNYNWQGRILEVREDRGFIDRDIRNGYHYRNVGPANNAMKAVQHSNHPMSSTNAHYNNSVYASQVSEGFKNQ